MRDKRKKFFAGLIFGALYNLASARKIGPKLAELYINIRYKLLLCECYNKDDHEKDNSSTHCIDPHPAKAKLSDTVSASEIYINGYTPTQWQLLTDNSYVPSTSSLMKMLNHCKKYGDDEAFQMQNSFLSWNYSSNSAIKESAMRLMNVGLIFFSCIEKHNMFHALLFILHLQKYNR